MATTVDTTPFEADAYVLVQWNDAPTVNHYSWRVYRRLSPGGTWELLTQDLSGGVGHAYPDYTAHANVSQDWAVVEVTQNPAPGSPLVEGAKTPVNATPFSTDYWLVYPSDPTMNLKLEHVTADSFHDELEQAAVNLIGRGRKFDMGTDFGVAGSLVADFRDVSGGLTGRQQSDKLHALRKLQEPLYLRNPFGDVWKVALGQLDTTRVPGVGIREFTGITIPYSEVAD
jgi:hypothetical protein